MSAIASILLAASSGHPEQNCFDPRCSLESASEQRETTGDMWVLAWERIGAELPMGTPADRVTLDDLRDAAQVEVLVSGACQ